MRVTFYLLLLLGFGLPGEKRNWYFTCPTQSRDWKPMVVLVAHCSSLPLHIPYSHYCALTPASSWVAFVIDVTACWGFARLIISHHGDCPKQICRLGHITYVTLTMEFARYFSEAPRGKNYNWNLIIVFSSFAFAVRVYKFLNHQAFFPNFASLPYFISYFDIPCCNWGQIDRSIVDISLDRVPLSGGVGRKLYIGCRDCPPSSRPFDVCVWMGREQDALSYCWLSGSRFLLVLGLCSYKLDVLLLWTSLPLVLYVTIFFCFPIRVRAPLHQGICCIVHCTLLFSSVF